MKRRVKKLVLAKETVRRMEAADLMTAAGGSPGPFSANTTPSCAYPECVEGILTEGNC